MKRALPKAALFFENQKEIIMEKEIKQSIYSVGEAGKLPDINMGSHQLYAFLKEHKVVHRNNFPFQEYVQKGFF